MECKVCNVCGKTKTVDSFNIFYNTKKLREYCKICEKNKRHKRDVKYRDNNRNKVNDSVKKYRENNKEKIKEYDKKYRQNNKEKINKKNRIWRNKVSKDPYYIIKNNTSKMISKVIKRNGYSKKSKTNEILGCSYEEFKEHIESKWEDWMNWNNYGNPKDGILEENKTWDIDHVVPISSAETEDDIIKLNHFTNLQPLCSYVNRIIKKDII
jgi:hypothetical protein